MKNKRYCIFWPHRKVRKITYCEDKKAKYLISYREKTYRPSPDVVSWESTVYS